MDTIKFFKTYYLAISLIASSVIFPLMIGYVKNQWDIANWKRQNLANEIQTKQKLYIQKRSSIIDEIRNLYIGYIIEAQFLITDHELKRLNTELGREHKAAYDLFAKRFFRESIAKTFDVKYYFSKGDILSARLITLNGWSAAIDLAITSIAENTSNINTHRKISKSKWQFIPTGIHFSPDADKQIPVPKKGDKKEIEKYKWANINKAIYQLSTATTELLEAMASELKPDASVNDKTKDIIWKNDVDSKVLHRAKTGRDVERQNR